LARHVLDDWLPPVIREFRPLSKVLAVAFHGRSFDLDFKRKAYDMSCAEFAAAYARLPSGCKHAYRTTDMTDRQIEWMVGSAVGPEVLEVGCGYGVLAERMAARREFLVTATDLSTQNVELVRRRFNRIGLNVRLEVADAERLPFDDKSFDSTLTAHTLEHVRDFERAVRELIRVTRRRLLVIVPCQRYYRYTIDYHLHFFPEPEQLILRMKLPRYHCQKLDGDLCYYAEVSCSDHGCRHDDSDHGLEGTAGGR
jgi:ubiquinone/menaquinone biosynthesis C-methylase UbiE